MTEAFLPVGDRVMLHYSDRDGHVFSKDVKGTVEAVYSPDEVEVRWDDDEYETWSENDLVLV